MSPVDINVYLYYDQPVLRLTTCLYYHLPVLCMALVYIITSLSYVSPATHITEQLQINLCICISGYSSLCSHVLPGNNRGYLKETCQFVTIQSTNLKLIITPFPSVEAYYLLRLLTTILRRCIYSKDFIQVT